MQAADDDEADFGMAGLSQDSSTQDTVLNSQVPATPDTQLLTNKPAEGTQGDPTGTPDTQPMTNPDGGGRGTPDTQPLTHQPTPDTLPLTEEPSQPAAAADREAPGFMEEDCGFLMLSSDDGDEGVSGESGKKKMLTKKKKAKKLVLSDDSDSEGEEETTKMKDVSTPSDAEEGSKSDNEEDKVVMYDSDENAITMAEYKQKFKGFKNKKGK